MFKFFDFFVDIIKKVYNRHMVTSVVNEHSNKKTSNRYSKYSHNRTSSKRGQSTNRCIKEYKCLTDIGKYLNDILYSSTYVGGYSLNDINKKIEELKHMLTS